ncbi:MAG: DUF996 domain-containing protein, partial [Candidatus Bathyarchaeota archaeon]|nr:DUF996 domain-containing protein [Candidatus Termiticorpusculum sp.]
FENYQTVGTLAKKPPNYCNVAPLEQTTFTTVILILLILGTKDVAEHYKDDNIYQHVLKGGIFSVIGTVCSYAAIFTIWTLIGPIICLIVAFVFMLLSAMNFKKAFNILADRSGENLFRTAGTLLWIGAILTIILVGAFLVFIGFIIAGIAFLTLKPTQNQPTYNYSTPPPSAQPTEQPYQSTTASNIKANFCPNCGSPVAPDASFCASCGKQI